jgi:basic amino acid/polyamine antiporter, APA family
MNDIEPTEQRGGLGLWDTISIIVGIVIGTTIFKIPENIFQSASDPWSALLVWAVGGVLALIGAMCYAELGTTYPRSGGDYAYLTRAFGPWAGFVFGWAQLVVVFTASIGMMAIVFGEFATGIKDLSGLVQVDLSSELLYAMAAVLALSLLNILGVVFGKFAQNLLTLAKVIGILAILVAGFGWAQSNPIDWRAEKISEFGWSAFAIIMVLYAYGGWNDAAFVTAEVRDRERNVPRALILGVGIITAIYLLVNMAYLTGLGLDQAKSSNRLPALLLAKPFGEHGAIAMSALVMVSALGAANGLILTGARVYATLGNDYPLFGWLGHWRPRRGAPILALLVQALITVGMLFALGTRQGHEYVNELLVYASRVGEFLGFDAIELERSWTAGKAFDTLFSHTAPVFWFFFLMTGLSLFILREKNPNLPRPFSVPFYPVLPIIFCNTCVYMLYKSVAYVGGHALFAIALVLVGLPLYWLSRRVGYRGE